MSFEIITDTLESPDESPLYMRLHLSHNVEGLRHGMLCLPGSGSTGKWGSSTLADQDQGGADSQNLSRSGVDQPDSAATSNGMRPLILLIVVVSDSYYDLC